MTTADSRFRASKFADDYELEYLLGRGGGSKVYRARQASTGQAVAVKILELDPSLEVHAQQRRKDRFRREMKIYGRLAHPDIVRLLDYGEHGELLYFVLELVSGQTLARLLTDAGALTVALTRTLLGQLLEALSHAHAHGVIHRDLKPSNIMVTGEGKHARVKILDFGISAIPGGSLGRTLTRLTLSNEMVGTPSYAAPEQLRGDTPTTKTDLYSLGLVALECLTGRSAMSGSSLGEIFQNQLSSASVPIPPRLSGHPLGTLLRWMLEKEPARRASSASELLRRLEAITKDELSKLEDVAGYFSQQVSRDKPARAEELTVTAPGVRVEGERRLVTALCCRLPLCSTSDNVEPALLDVCRSDLFGLARATIEEFGGVAVGGFGELALYYFGVPRAQDTDARMAACAALELSSRVRTRSAVLSAQFGVEVALRAGLHCGLLTAGDRGASGIFAHGEVAAIAVALTDAGGHEGEPQITVSDAYRRLTARHGDFASVVDTPTLTLPWRSAGLTIYELTSESLSDVFAQGVAPMIGRDDELATLVSAWRESGQGSRFVLIKGEAGIGKSRLAHELRLLARAEGQGILRLRFLPEMKHVALRPLLELICAELELDLTPSCAELVAALRRFDVNLDEAVPLMCMWTSAVVESPWTTLPFSPQKQRVMLYELIVDITCALLEQRSGYLQVEDLHWADPSTVDWLGRLLCVLDATGGFAVMTARPSFSPRWGGFELLELELGALGGSQVAALVSEVTAGKGLDAGMVDAIIERADGVPLFVEELARVFADGLDDDELGEMPTTLRALMTSRLDALGPAKVTAQFAAAIGREFDRGLLRASMPDKDEATLLADLDELISARIILARRRVGYQSYLFRHALVRDAAYQSMTASGREAVHDAIVEGLLDSFPKYAQSRPDLVGLHLEFAGRTFESQRYWLLAGRAAVEAVAHEEALAHLERGLETLRRCPATPQRNDAELDLIGVMIAAHIAQLGYGAPQLGALMDRTRALIEDGTTSPSHTFPLLWGQYLYKCVQPDHDSALALATEILERATAINDRGFYLQGRSILIRTHFWRAEFIDSLEHIEVVDTGYDHELLHHMWVITGEDPRWAGLFHAALALVAHGRTVSGLELAERIAKRARETARPGLAQASWTGPAHALVLRGMNDPHGEDLAASLRYSQRALEGASQLGFPFWQGYAGTLSAAAKIYSGDRAGIQEMEMMLDAFAGAGSRIGRGWNLDTLAYGYIDLGDFDKAEEILAAARAHIESSSERVFAAVNLRFRARLLRVRGDAEPEAIEALLRESMAVARAQGSQLFEAQSMVDLLDFLESQGRPEAERSQLRASASWSADAPAEFASLPVFAGLF